MAGLTPPQIEDDAQENQVGEDGMSDLKSPGADDIVSPASHASQGSRAMVRDSAYKPRVHAIDVQQPNKLNTSVPVRTRADSNDDAPPSVIHAPAHFKQFVCFASDMVALPRR
jgi:hypothetical protein